MMKKWALEYAVFLFVFACVAISRADIYLQADLLIKTPIGRDTQNLKKHRENLDSIYNAISTNCHAMPDSFRIHVCPYYLDRLKRRIVCCSLIISGTDCPTVKSDYDKCQTEFDTYIKLLKTSRYWLNSDTLNNVQKSNDVKEAFWSIMEQASKCAVQNPGLMARIQELAIAIFSDTTILMQLLREEKNPVKLRHYGESFLENVADKMRTKNITEDEVNTIVDLLVDIRDTSRADLTGKQFIAILELANKDAEFRRKLLKTINSKNIDLIFILSEYKKFFEILFDGSPDKFRAFLKETAKKIGASKNIESSGRDDQEIDRLTKQAYVILTQQASEKYGIAGIVPPRKEGKERLPKEVFTKPVYDSLINRLKANFLIKEIEFLDAEEIEKEIYSPLSPDDTVFVKESLLKTWNRLTRNQAPSFYLYLPYTVDSLSRKISMYIRLIDTKKGIIHAHSRVNFDFFDTTISSKIDTLVNTFLQRLYVARIQAEFRNLVRDESGSGHCIEITKGAVKGPDSNKLQNLRDIDGITISRVFMQNSPKNGDRYAVFHNLLFEHLTSYFKGFIDVQVNVPAEQHLFIDALNVSSDSSSIIFGIKWGHELLYSLELPIVPVTGKGSEEYYTPYLEFICSFVEILLKDKPEFKKWKATKLDVKPAYKDTSISIKPLTYVPMAIVPAGLPHIIKAFSAKQKWQYSLTGAVLFLGQIGTGVLWASREMFHDYGDENTIFMKQNKYNDRFFEGAVCGGVIGIFQGLSVATLAHLDIREKKNITSGFFKVQATVSSNGGKIQFSLNSRF